MPTPADMAARPRQPLTARPLQQGGPRQPVPLPLPTLAADAPLRTRWETSIQRSTLHAHARLIALTIAAFCDWSATDRLPMTEVGPTRLSRASGLPRGMVRTSLINLQQGRWIERTPAPSDAEHNLLQLLMPPTHARE